MKPTAVIFFTFFISLATAIPVAEVERQIFGRNIQSVPSSHGTSNRLSKRSPPGPRKRPQIIERSPTPPNYGRYKGDDEPQRDYQKIVKTIPKYPLGWQGERQSTPPDRETGFVVRNPKKVDYYYGKETEYTADGWDKLVKLYPEYSNHGFSKRPKANIRPSKGGNSVRPETLGGIDSEDEWDREEEPPNGFDYPQGRYIVHRAPRIESKYQSTMFTQAGSRVDSDAKHHFHSNYKNNPADTVIVRGPRDPLVDNGRTPRYAIPRSRNRDIDAILYPEDRPVLRGSRGGSQDPQIITIAPNSKRGGSTRYTSSQKKREEQSSTTTGPTSVDEITERDIITTISGDEGNANSSSRAEQIAQIQDYLWAFDEARQNASNLLYPFLVDVLNGTNGYVGEMLAWGLWSMIWPDSIIDGAFRMGFSSFGMDASNFTGPYAQALSDWSYSVENFYFDIYAEAEEAVNKTGLLQDLLVLGTYLQPGDLTLLPDSETQVDEHALDPFYGFLESMYAYNGYPFTANQTANGTADYRLYLEDYASSPSNTSVEWWINTVFANSTSNSSSGSASNTTLSAKKRQLPVHLTF